jgi:hypothetical protein
MSAEKSLFHRLRHGRHARAKDLEHLSSGIKIVNPIMGVAFWKDRSRSQTKKSPCVLKNQPWR